MGIRKGFTSAQKLAAALSIINGSKSQVEAGRELGCHPTLVSGWRDSVVEKGTVIFETAASEIEKDKKIAKLEHLIGRLTVENGFLRVVCSGGTLERNQETHSH